MFNLKPPQSIFVHADGFLRAAGYLNKPPETGRLDPLCFAALVANSAFASELYLKCLIRVDTGQIVKAEHDLRKLFLKLPPNTQAEIETPFNAQMAKNPIFDLSKISKEAAAVIAMRPKTLRDALTKGRTAFVEWRYLYEDEGALRTFDLFGLPPILRKVILVRHPEWAGFSIKLTEVGHALPTSLTQKTPTPGAPAAGPDGNNQ